MMMNYNGVSSNQQDEQLWKSPQNLPEEQQRKLRLAIDQIKRTGKYDYLTELVEIAELVYAMQQAPKGVILLPKTCNAVCQQIGLLMQQIDDLVQQVVSGLAELEFWLNYNSEDSPIAEIRQTGVGIQKSLEGLNRVTEELISLANDYGQLPQNWSRRAVRYCAEALGLSPEEEKLLLQWHCDSLRYSCQFLLGHVQVELICREWVCIADWRLYSRRFHGYLATISSHGTTLGKLLEQQVKARVPKVEDLIGE
jgi:hypothetical protein